MSNSHPYEAYEKTQTWKAVEKAIDALVTNGDLVEQTPREYIVGHLTQAVLQRSLSSRQLRAAREKIVRLGDASRQAEFALVELDAETNGH